MIEGKPCIVLFGLAGSGKGTQASVLREKFGFFPISPGELMREMKASGKLPKDIENDINAGKLAPVEFIIELVASAISEANKRPEVKGILLDGFPRSEEQNDLFLKAMKNGDMLDLCILLDIKKQVLMERLKGRIECIKCGTLFNKITNPTKKVGVCDICGGKEFKTRVDDSQVEAMNRRIEVFLKETMPVINFYKNNNLLQVLNAEESIDDVSKNISKLITPLFKKT